VLTEIDVGSFLVHFRTHPANQVTSRPRASIRVSICSRFCESQPRHPSRQRTFNSGGLLYKMGDGDLSDDTVEPQYLQLEWQVAEEWSIVLVFLTLVNVDCRFSEKGRVVSGHQVDALAGGGYV